MRLAQLFSMVLIATSAAALAASFRGPRFQPEGMPSTMPVRCQVWHNLPGAQITDTLATDDLEQTPLQTQSIGPLEFAPGFKDEWACSMSALIAPPVTGKYTFSIAARDSGILFLSSDATMAHRKYIAEVPSATDIHTYRWYSSQASRSIELVAGKRYFIQAICKSGPGPGGISVGWTLPNGTFQGPIPADRLREYTGDVTLPDQRVHRLILSLKPDQPPTTQPGIHKFVRGAHVDVDGDSQDLSYLMFMPKSIETSTDPLPMMVFLHGNNRQGYSLTGVEQTGPLRNIEANAKLRDWLPMIVLAPQLPPDWRWDTPGAAQSVNALVEQLCRRYPRIDRHRIYLTGLSMGGKGTWLTLEDSPQTYAAVAPISAVDVRPDLAPELLKNLPELHIICGGNDNGFTAGSKRMYAALKPALGDRVQLTVFDHEGHGVWDHFYPTQAFYEELLKFSK